MRERRERLRSVQGLVRGEAVAWGMLTALHNAFINPVLIGRGAGPLALGIFNSGANLFGLGTAFLGPRLAARVGSVPRVIIAVLFAARLVFLGIALVLVLTETGSVSLLIALVLLWSMGEGIALPLWTALLAGLAGPSERGRWLAARAAFAAGSAAVVLLLLVGLFPLIGSDLGLPIAYWLAGLGAVASLWQMRLLLNVVPPPPPPPLRSARHLPVGKPARQFLGGVFCFWFGAGLIWPVLPPYLIDELDAPTAYFGAAAVVAALIGIVVQRGWGRIGDHQGARALLTLSGLGVGLVPLLWAAVPLYWLGIGVELVAAGCWPGHVLGLTMRSIELADDEADRPTLLAWTSLAQCGGAATSPLIASLIVGWTGTIPLLIAAGFLRWAGTALIGQPPARFGGVLRSAWLGRRR